RCPRLHERSTLPVCPASIHATLPGIPEEPIFVAPVDCVRDGRRSATTRPMTQAGMNRDLGKPTPSTGRLAAAAAVRRGHAVVTLPVLLIMLGLWGLAEGVLRRASKLVRLPLGLQIVVGVAVVIGPPALAWVWWAFTVPRWRHWALSRGADPQLLQELGEAQGLVWPRGSFL